MEIGTIIFLENPELEKAISDIGRLSIKDTSIEYFIVHQILTDTLKEYSPAIKLIFDKYRTLILQENTNEIGFQKLVEKWDDYFDEQSMNLSESLKKDLFNIKKLVQMKYSILDIFIAVYNGVVLKRQTNYEYWKFRNL